MAPKPIKNVTETLVMFDDFPQNLKLAEMAVKWLRESLTAYEGLGITFALNNNPEKVDDWQAQLTIEMSGPKQYLGVEELRTRGVQIRSFCIGAAYALGQTGVDKKITV